MNIIMAAILIQLFFFNLGFYSVFIKSSDSLCHSPNFLLKTLPLHDAGCVLAEAILNKE